MIQILHQSNQYKSNKPNFSKIQTSTRSKNDTNIRPAENILAKSFSIKDFICFIFHPVVIYLRFCVKAFKTPSRSPGLISFCAIISSTSFSMMLESDGSSLSSITTPENMVGGDRRNKKNEEEEEKKEMEGWSGGSEWNLD